MNVEQDSSSDDDSSCASRHDQMLREALDTTMFSVQKHDSKDIKEQETCKKYDSNVLNVTPQFQEFVAKRLSETLDEVIQEYQSEKLQLKSDTSAGIQLFSDSKTLLKDRKFSDSYESCDAKSRISSPRRRKKKVKRTPVEHEKDELTELQKVQEVAVPAEWILNGECTRGWSKPKGQVFAYRKNENGILQEVNSQ